MAVPKKKTARSRSKTRHSAYMQKTRKKLLDSVQLVECENCNEKRQAHIACGNCGYFKGKEVAPKEKAEVTTVQA